MILVFKIIYVVLILIALFMLYSIANKLIASMNSDNLMERDIEIYKLDFSEEKILSHLDFIIQDCLDYYVAMQLTPKQLYYINNNLEEQMTKDLAVTVSDRISPTLYTQLSLIYNADQISTVISEKIYTKILEYVISFNVQNDQNKNKKINN